jgi:hypothetical protein
MLSTPASQGFTCYTSMEGDANGDLAITPYDLALAMQHLGATWTPGNGNVVPLATDFSATASAPGVVAAPVATTAGVATSTTAATANDALLAAQALTSAPDATLSADVLLGALEDPFATLRKR